MRHVQAGFVGEGPRDAQFLAPLARRLLEDHLLGCSSAEVLVPDPEVIRPHGAWGNKPEAVLDELQSEFAHLDLLLYHTDAGGNLDGAYAHRVDAVRSVSPVPVTGVVPRREMEAWALADPDALCAALGVDATKMSSPPEFVPRRVESISDPKVALDEFTNPVPGRHFSSSDPSLSLLGALALTIDLNVVRRVPQVRRLAQEIADLSTAKGWQY